MPFDALIGVGMDVESEERFLRCSPLGPSDSPDFVLDVAPLLDVARTADAIAASASKEAVDDLDAGAPALTL